MKNSYFLALALLMAVVVAVATTPVETTNFLTSHSKQNERIILGQYAQPKQFPYIVYLDIIGTTNNESWYCGGSLISRDTVITGAHCALNATGGKAILGAIKIDNPNEIGQITITLSKSSFIVHESYKSNSLDFDIAIVKLPQKVELNDYVNIINLPDVSDSQKTFAGKNAVISGWGLFTPISPHICNCLLYGNVVVLSNLVCQLSYIQTLKSTMICGQGVQETCYGDSGGPLAYYNGTNDVLIGITSYGLLLCAGSPSVFTRVTSYLDWINPYL